MAWKIEYLAAAEKELSKLSRSVQIEIVGYLDRRIATAADPRSFGKPLRQSMRGLWRYRVGDYRVVCRIEDSRLVVLVIKVGHRSKVYD